MPGERPGESSDGDPLGGLELIEAPEEDLLAHSAEWRDRYQQVTMGASQKSTEPTLTSALRLLTCSSTEVLCRVPRQLGGIRDRVVEGSEVTGLLGHVGVQRIGELLGEGARGGVEHEAVKNTRP